MLADNLLYVLCIFCNKYSLMIDDDKQVNLCIY